VSDKCETAFLVGIKDIKESIEDAKEHLDELISLVDTMGLTTVGTDIAILREINPRTYIGSGKLIEIVEKAKQSGADIIIFDTELSPRQQRNIEELGNTPCIDRQEVILDIFAERAQTREATIQIQIAKLEYSLPRLTRAWTNLSRQRGGTKGNRGKGETQLESDRRYVQKYLTELKRELREVEKSRQLLRKKRSDRPVPSGAIVGYTNAGKSSLLNLLAGSNVLAENKLFATLDPTSRKIALPGGREFILTDTVGFIRKLPHDLVAAFKSTLEEASFADFILLVLDITSPNILHHQKVTLEVLEELGIKDKPIITVLNKIDALEKGSIEELNLRFFTDAIKISTYTKDGIDNLKQEIMELLASINMEVTFVFPLNRWDLLSFLKRECAISKEEYLEDGIKVCAKVSDKIKNQLSEFIVPLNP